MSLHGNQVRWWVFSWSGVLFLWMSITGSISWTGGRFPKTLRASQPEVDVRVRPVLEERSAERGRQEQEVLLSQSQTHVGAARGTWAGAGGYRRDVNGTLSLSQVGQRHQGGARTLPREEKVDNGPTAPNQKAHPVSV